MINNNTIGAILDLLLVACSNRTNTKKNKKKRKKRHKMKWYEVDRGRKVG